MDGINEIVGAIEESRSSPSADLPNGGWVEPNPVSGGGGQSDPSPISEPGYIQEAGDINPDADAYGEVFDPFIHDPKRTKNKNGRWRRQKGKGKAVVQIIDPGGVKRAACRRAAEQFVGQFVALTIGFAGGPNSECGKEWTPVTTPYDEREAMVAAWEDYFFQHGIVSMPPWLAVTIAMGTYAGTRILMPHTQEKIKAVREWAKNRKAKGKPNDSNGQATTVGDNNATVNWGTRVEGN